MRSAKPGHAVQCWNDEEKAHHSGNTQEDLNEVKKEIKKETSAKHPCGFYAIITKACALIE